MSNFMKIPLLEAELFDTVRQTDKTELWTAFYNFANAPQKLVTHLHCSMNWKTQTYKSPSCLGDMTEQNGV